MLERSASLKHSNVNPVLELLTLPSYQKFAPRDAPAHWTMDYKISISSVVIVTKAREIQNSNTKSVRPYRWMFRLKRFFFSTFQLTRLVRNCQNPITTIVRILVKLINRIQWFTYLPQIVMGQLRQPRSDKKQFF